MVTTLRTHRASAVALACREARYAFDRTPAYRALLASAGATPDVADGTSFRSLPLTDKSYYRSNYPRGVVASGTVLSDEPHLLKSQSSGTGGDRLTTVAYTYDLAQRMADTLSVHPTLKGRLLRIGQQRIGRYAAPNCSDVECAAPNSTMQSRMLRDGTLVLPVGHDLLVTGPDLVDQALREIDVYAPDWFYTDATHFAYLLRQYRARGLAAPEPQAVILTYTLATQVARHQIRGVLDPSTPFAEVVSMTEMGWVAMECEQATLHLNSSTFYVELLSPDTLDPVGAGAVGELVITSLRDRLLPHVRYRTGDLYRLLAPCSCGHPFPAVRHEGRTTHVLQLPGGGTLTPKALDDIVGPDPHLIAYRAHQHAPRRFRFKYIVAAGAPSTAGDAVEERVRAALGRGALLTTEGVDYIPSELTGKFLSCVSDVAWPGGPVA